MVRYIPFLSKIFKPAYKYTAIARNRSSASDPDTNPRHWPQADDETFGVRISALNLVTPPQRQIPNSIARLVF